MELYKWYKEHKRGISLSLKNLWTRYFYASLQSDII